MEMKKSSFMKCPRCGSNMIHDKFYGSTEEYWGCKCLLCGEIIDPVILDNRQLMRTGQLINSSSVGMRTGKNASPKGISALPA
jgi:hypothetical protein